jgi:two-component system KDP operon response regulator KdpE
VTRVLVVDDEPQLLRALRINLRARDYEVHVAPTGTEALRMASAAPPDIVVLDLGLPDLDGVEVIHGLRGWTDVPIIVLSGRSGSADKVAALDAGADDYVTKPFGIGELLARVRVALRHATHAGSASGALKLGDAVIDLEARRATRAGQAVHLTPIEYRLVACLAKHLGMVVTHRQLLTEVWGPTHLGDTHYLRIYMKQLRDKLETDPVQPCYFITETGVGYRLLADD